MKIAFPSLKKLDRESPVHNHFGSAPYFIVIDTEKDQDHTIDNRNLNHVHGNCQPLVALGGTAVDAVVVGGIGGGALRKLIDEGIKVFRAVEGTVRENLALMADDKLPAFGPEHTCRGHEHQIGGCIH